MRTRTLLIVSIGILLFAALSPASEPGPMENNPAPAEFLNAPPQTAREIRIFTLRYQEADELARILRTLTSPREATMTTDDASQKLIVAASLDRLRQIEAVIRELDVPQVSGEPEARQVLYRIYMLELPPANQRLKPFLVTLESPSQLVATDFFTATNDPELQVSSFRQGSELAKSGNVVFTIQGRASNAALMRTLGKIPDAVLTEMGWSGNALSEAASVGEAAQVEQLPAPLQEHIRKFLGDDVQTVAYWFGNLSLPGEVRAPIGPWMIELNVESEQAGEVALEISVVRESQIDSIPSMEILSNSVRGKVGKPIIIGYNRDRYGTRTMGAMVIVPEVDTTPASK
jgi:hypothetical protein